MRYLLAMVLMAGCSSCSDGKHGAGERAMRVSDGAADEPDGTPARAEPAVGRSVAAETATVD